MFAGHLPTLDKWIVTRVFNWQFGVRGYELGADRRVHTRILHNYLEETAIRASSDAGYGMPWYFERQQAWVMRHMTARYLSPLTLGERIAARSWVSDFRRIYSHREYDLRCASDHRPVIRARVKWVYVDLDSMRLLRIPQEFEAAFDPSGVQEDIDIRLKQPEVFADGPVYQTEHRVLRSELDAMGHVNNAVYVDWFEQAMFDALATAGWTEERLAEAGLLPVVTGNEVDYLLPALNGAALNITSQFIEQNEKDGAWQHEVRDAQSGEVLARGYAVCQFVQLADNQPCSLPESVIKSLLAG